MRFKEVNKHWNSLKITADKVDEMVCSQELNLRQMTGDASKNVVLLLGYDER